MLRTFLFSAVLLVPKFILYMEHIDHTDLKIFVFLHVNKLFAIRQHVNLLS